MNHLSLAQKFNDFAYELIDKESSAKSSCTSLSCDLFYRRIIFSRLYYALYHKYLAHDADLSSKTGSSKHEQILKRIQQKDERLAQVFTKLLEFRCWADYHEDRQDILTVKLKFLAKEVYSILNRDKI